MGRISSYNRYDVIPGATGYQTHTVTNASAGLSGIPQKANACTITVTANAATTGDAVFVTLNGQDASVTKGLALRDGAVLELFEGEVTRARFISADGNNQTLKVEFAFVS